MSSFGSKAQQWRRVSIAFLPSLLIASGSLGAASLSEPAVNVPPVSERQIATYDPSPFYSSVQLPKALFEDRMRAKVTEARYVLNELQAFVDEARRAVELGEQLRSRHRENSLLKRLLETETASKIDVENHVGPRNASVSALTRIVVRNWLETIRLQQRSDDMKRRLSTSEASWLAIEERVAELRRRLAERRHELAALRVESAALALELGRTRRQLTRTQADTARFDHERQQITEVTQELRRATTARLRTILLENAAR